MINTLVSTLDHTWISGCLGRGDTLCVCVKIHPHAKFVLSHHEYIIRRSTTLPVVQLRELEPKPMKHCKLSPGTEHTFKSAHAVYLFP